MNLYYLPPQSVRRGALILVNPQYRYMEEASPERVRLTEAHANVLLHPRAAVLLNALMQKIGGWDEIVPVSGWRSQREQQAIWDSTLAESGAAFTRKFVALPGHSEHQTGLAIDLAQRQDEIDYICPDFPNAGACALFRRYAADYGFVERYPAGRESVTGIGHEPWHFRYVGVPHAAIMAEGGMTLEEYIEFIKAYPRGGRHLCRCCHGQEIFVSYLYAEPGKETRLELDGTLPYSVSGNNIDGFIITEWRKLHGRDKAFRRP